jgi:hypothetical protein
MHYLSPEHSRDRHRKKKIKYREQDEWNPKRVIGVTASAVRKMP